MLRSSGSSLDRVIIMTEEQSYQIGSVSKNLSVTEWCQTHQGVFILTSSVKSDSINLAYDYK